MHVEQGLLLDTNIWLDFYLGERTGHQAARVLIEHAVQEGVALLVAVVSLKDVYYIIGASIKRSVREERGSLDDAAAAAADAAAWACLESIDSLATVVPVDASDIWIARKQRNLHPDFEDDLVLAAAMRSQASLLVTNDSVLASKAPIAAMTSSDALLAVF